MTLTEKPVVYQTDLQYAIDTIFADPIKEF